MEQRTKNWHIARLGKFTGSEVGKIMGKGRAKDEPFSTTGKSYITKKVAERTYNIDYITEHFEDFLDTTNVTTKQMRYGIEMEDVVKKMIRDKGVDLQDCEFIEITPNFGDSPDGYDPDLNEAYEVKCLGIEKQYEVGKFFTPEDFEKWDAVYFWQCVAHAVALKCEVVNFVVFNEFAQSQIVTYRLYVTEEMKQQLLDKVELAVNTYFI